MDHGSTLSGTFSAHGTRRAIVAVVPGFPDALRIAAQSDLVALIPRSRSCLGDVSFGQGLVSFELPVATPEIAVSAMWHPRMEAILCRVSARRKGSEKYVDRVLHRNPSGALMRHSIEPPELALHEPSLTQ
jgi:hypothetical protein